MSYRLIYHRVFGYGHERNIRGFFETELGFVNHETQEIFVDSRLSPTLKIYVLRHEIVHVLIDSLFTYRSRSCPGFWFIPDQLHTTFDKIEDIILRKIQIFKPPRLNKAQLKILKEYGRMI